jgi:hypothetical protein
MARWSADENGLPTFSRRSPIVAVLPELRRRWLAARLGR